MKTTFAALLILCMFTACKQAPKPLNVYTVTLKGKESLLMNGIKYPGVLSTDTVMCANDTAAYEQGLFGYYGKLSAEKKTKNVLSITESFTVTDSAGLDIGIRLGDHVTDSLEQQVKKLAAKL